MKLSPNVREMVKYAEECGFVLHRVTHHIIMHKDGHSLAIPKTPSDHRTFLNKKTEIKHLLQRIEAGKKHESV